MIGKSTRNARRYCPERQRDQDFLSFRSALGGPETESTFIPRQRRRTKVVLLRKEVIHRQLPLPMPCYDFTPVTGLTLNSACAGSSGITRFHGVTGGVYKIRERIHRDEADSRLLAIPASRGRVAALCPN